MNDKYLIGITSFSGFGPVRTKLLMDYFKSAKKIWSLDASKLTHIGLSQRLVNAFVSYRKNFDIDAYMKRLKDLKINYLTIFDERYPINLKSIDDCPYVLYVRGKIKNVDEDSVAIVGTRMMTGYGREMAAKFASELAGFGVTVVSGLALGVDAQAQRSTLSAGGRTIAVLASGLDIISPLSNKSLALELIKGSGAIVSEYPLGHKPFKGDFAIRNRLISGLSKAVVVIEGRMKSGTFHTVNAALRQGRPVFAVPGPITSPASEAPNYLIQNGAKPLLSVKDIMEELNIQTKVNKDKVESIMPTDKNEAKLVKILESGEIHLDELVRMSGLATNEVSARLTVMEMKGLAKHVGSGVYRKS